MKIHTVQTNDSIRSIAEAYRVPESRILFDNDLDPRCRLYPGQSLIIGEPAQTDSVRGGDTPERIAARNDTDVLTILQNNPHLTEAPYIPSQPVNVAYVGKNPRKIAVHAYTGTASEAQLRRRLPLVSLLSVQNAALLQGGRLTALTAAPKLAALARAYRAMPILCIEAYDAHGRYDTEAAAQILSSPDYTERFINSTLETAKQNGYGGIEVMLPPVTGGDAARCTELLLALQGLCEERGLLLLIPWLPNAALDGGAALNRMDIADFVPIWNYLYDDGKNASAAAPYDKADAVLSAGPTNRNAGKLFLGLPTFGIDYVRSANGYRKRVVSAEYICRGLPSPPEIQFNPGSRTPYAFYTETEHNGKTGHILCYENAQSYAEKLELMETHKLCGISVCSLAYDAPALWQLLSQTCSIAKG